MKKKIAWGIGLLAGAMTIGTAMTAMASSVTEEQARNTAMTHAGVAADQITYITSKMDYEKGVQVYEVEFFTKDYVEYDYEIRVSDGTVLSYDYDAETSFWKNGGSATGEIKIDLEKAKEIALRHAGKQAADVTFAKSGLEYDDGVAVYEVEFYTADFSEYDYEISAYSGEIVSYDFDAEHYQKPQTSASSAGAGITEEDAKAAALQIAGLSASEADYIAVHADRDDGRLIYEGKIYEGNLEYEFEVDAATGQVIDWDVESRFD